MAVNVWKSNVVAELEKISTLRQSYRLVAIDTMFPGFLRSTPRNAAEEERYRDVKFNVDSTHLIQVGITLFDESGNTPWPDCCWQFNFSDFDPALHAYSPGSVNFLLQNGHDLGKYRRKGIPSQHYAALLCDKLFGRHDGSNSKYVTFQGLYDVAYLISLFTQAPLPDTLGEFLAAASGLLGDFCDIKYISKFYDGVLGGELSLSNLSTRLLKRQPEGTHQQHQAGYDSLLFASVYYEMKRRYKDIKEDEERYTRVLFGVEKGCIESKKNGFRAPSIQAPQPTAIQFQPYYPMRQGGIVPCYPLGWTCQ